MAEVLLAIKPVFAAAILSGVKKVELRRRVPLWAPGTIVHMYASTPQRAVTGSFVVKEVLRAEPWLLWRDYHRDLHLNFDEFSSYLAGLSHGFAIEIESQATYPTPVSLEEIRSTLAIQPPQSFRYLSAPKVEQLRTLASVHPIQPEQHGEVEHNRAAG
ncbi:hypothetical protein QN345_02265 [Cryobacterium sp. 10I1]|uniref:hypothetical protein n=1 Tax=unclassified Cryobacterium TaxID=2649013 RepID=UPI002AC8F90F|nr:MULTISPECIES: hypothetical protein [unclassified Cryobacterium]MEB0003218.1 hypothetical protein [Cryobacterium sp. RTC2.1]MEB0286862.1 hypothetical protein [Cryobacterium sp. 10S3]MEB0304160.1 hypothetical protein [Cryobacterium sp. 10I1]WPX13456.1 hypothetical protein RHM57_17585 [Cryobacterium sp. 10S3]